MGTCCSLLIAEDPVVVIDLSTTQGNDSSLTWSLQSTSTPPNKCTHTHPGSKTSASGNSCVREDVRDVSSKSKPRRYISPCSAAAGSPLSSHLSEPSELASTTTVPVRPRTVTRNCSAPESIVSVHSPLDDEHRDVCSPPCYSLSPLASVSHKPAAATTLSEPSMAVSSSSTLSPPNSNTQSQTQTQQPQQQSSSQFHHSPREAIPLAPNILELTVDQWRKTQAYAFINEENDANAAPQTDIKKLKSTLLDASPHPAIESSPSHSLKAFQSSEPLSKNRKENDSTLELISTCLAHQEKLQEHLRRQKLKEESIKNLHHPIIYAPRPRRFYHVEFLQRMQTHWVTAFSELDSQDDTHSLYSPRFPSLCLFSLPSTLLSTSTSHSSNSNQILSHSSSSSSSSTNTSFLCPPPSSSSFSSSSSASALLTTAASVAERNPMNKPISTHAPILSASASHRLPHTDARRRRASATAMTTTATTQLAPTRPPHPHQSLTISDNIKDSPLGACVLPPLSSLLFLSSPSWKLPSPQSESSAGSSFDLSAS